MTTVASGLLLAVGAASNSGASSSMVAATPPSLPPSYGVWSETTADDWLEIDRGREKRRLEKDGAAAASARTYVVTVPRLCVTTGDPFFIPEGAQQTVNRVMIEGVRFETIDEANQFVAGWDRLSVALVSLGWSAMEPPVDAPAGVATHWMRMDDLVGFDSLIRQDRTVWVATGDNGFQRGATGQPVEDLKGCGDAGFGYRYESAEEAWQQSLQLLTDLVGMPDSDLVGPRVAITSPDQGAVVGNVDGSVTVRGTVAPAGARTEARPVVAFVVDTADTELRFDCDDDLVIDSDDDLNGDSTFGSGLDCAIAGALAILADLQGRPVHVLVVTTDGRFPLGTEEPFDPWINVEGEVPPLPLVTTSDNRLNDIVEGLRSLRPSADYNDDGWLSTLSDLADTRTVTPVLLTAADRSISVESLGVPMHTVDIAGGNPRRRECRANGTARQVAESSGGRCTIGGRDLGLALDRPPSWLDELTVALEGGTPIQVEADLFGTFSVRVPVSPGGHVATVTLQTNDGGQFTAERRFTVSADAVQYAALGDSFSSGEGVRVGPDEWLPDGVDRQCRRSAKAYGPLVAERFTDGASLRFVACTGAVLRDVISNGQHFGLPAQAEQLRGDEALVTMTIGGNDLLFSQILKTCLIVPDCADFPTVQLRSGVWMTADEWIRFRMDTLGDDLEAAYRRVRSQAPAAMVVALTYPKLLGDGPGSYVRLDSLLSPFLPGDECNALGWGPQEREWMAQTARDLATVIEAAARRAGVHFVDVDRYFEDRRVCDGETAGDEYITGVEYVHGFLGSIGGSPGVGTGSFHPNSRGQEKYADALVTYLASLGWDGGPLPENPEPTEPERDVGQWQRSSRLTSPVLILTVAGRSADFGGSLKGDSLEEVASLRTADLAIARRGEYGNCGAAFVPQERLSTRVVGLIPGAQSVVEVFDSQRIRRYDVVAGADGVLSAEVTLAAELQDGIVGIRVLSWGPTGAPVVAGPEAMLVSTEATCVDAATVAGRVGISTLPAAEVIYSTKPAWGPAWVWPSTDTSDVTAPSRGVGRLMVPVAVGLIVAIATAILVVRSRRRRGVP